MQYSSIAAQIPYDYKGIKASEVASAEMIWSTWTRSYGIMLKGRYLTRWRQDQRDYTIMRQTHFIEGVNI